jgi:hypothetical protein
MTVAAEHASLLHPENIGEGIGAYIEGEVADKNVFLERHVGRFAFSGADVNVGTAVFLYDGRETAFCVNDSHVVLRRRPGAICDSRRERSGAIRGASIHLRAFAAIALADVRPIFVQRAGIRKAKQNVTNIAVARTRTAIAGVSTWAAARVLSGLSSVSLGAMPSLTPSARREETP